MCLVARSLVSDLAGRVLAGRYLLHSAIGTGASGRVYLAEDTRLRRRVAVKILHAALAEDSAFLRRFRAEAQVAASLHHPHIVTVHDWGEDDVPFMVLELLEGGSLRSILDQETHLSVPQAAGSGATSRPRSSTRTRGILHRDIKPANLLFDEHGIVRVADFGLARALAEASWTEPSGAVFGTARYASPEQAMGVQLDARSDLYSLSLVLIEAVTGKVPFAADTTIGMLTARTQRPVTAPRGARAARARRRSGRPHRRGGALPGRGDDARRARTTSASRCHRRARSRSRAWSTSPIPTRPAPSRPSPLARSSTRTRAMPRCPRSSRLRATARCAGWCRSSSSRR